jgi:GH18 family chitinase
MDYIKEWNLGGVITWMLGEDSKGTLLKLMHDSLNPGET